MTDDELIVEALDHYFGELDPTDHETMDQLLKLSAKLASKAPVRPVEGLAQLDVYDRVGSRPEALERHKAGHPNADGTMEDTRSYPTFEY